MSLFDFGINIDGTTSCGIGPCDDAGLANLSGVSGVDDPGFSYLTGLGTINVEISGASAHYVGLFMDHSIDEDTNTFFNEFALGAGVVAAGQNLEIDEPGFLFGDIYDNYLAGTFDNTNRVTPSSPDDVSMGLSWDFTLLAGEFATISFLLSETNAPSGSTLFIAQFDTASPDIIYFSSTLSIERATAVPEPGTLGLLGAGLLGLAFMRRKRA